MTHGLDYIDRDRNKTKKFILLDQDITRRIELRKNDKGKGGDAILGHLPQAWQLPRGVPIPMYLCLFLRRCPYHHGKMNESMGS